MQNWIDQELTAAKLQLAISELYSTRHVEMMISGRTLIGESSVSLYQYLTSRRKKDNIPYTLDDALEVVHHLLAESLHPCRIDLSLLVSQWVMLERPSDFTKFFQNTIGRRFLSPSPRTLPVLGIVVLGFGRIARILTRILSVYGPASPLVIRGVVARSEGKDALRRRAYLLANDTIHGKFPGHIEIDERENSLTVNGNKIYFLEFENSPLPDRLPDESRFLLDTTGRFNSSETFSEYLKKWDVEAAGTSYTVPGLPVIIHGCNQYHIHELENKYFSFGSDPANAAMPLLRVLHDELIIKNCHVSIVRPYTNDQNLLDNIHITPRMGRSAPGNLIMTRTDLPDEIYSVLPELKGRITADLLRVPVLNGGLFGLHLETETVLDRNELNELLAHLAKTGDLRGQLEYSDAPDLVSSDVIGNPHSAIVDPLRTVANLNRSIVYAWYDNEYGYAFQMIRVLQELTNLSVMLYS